MKRLLLLRIWFRNLVERYRFYFDCAIVIGWALLLAVGLWLTVVFVAFFQGNYPK